MRPGWGSVCYALMRDGGGVVARHGAPLASANRKAGVRAWPSPLPSSFPRPTITPDRTNIYIMQYCDGTTVRSED